MDEQLFTVAFWSWASGVLLLVVDVIASLHAVLHKRDSRAAISWVGLIWLAPGVGVLLYGLFGLNRIRRQAAELQRAARAGTRESSTALTHFVVPAPRPRLAGMALLAERLSGRPLTTGNSITPLANGDEAYPAMLAAIDAATRSVT